MNKHMKREISSLDALYQVMMKAIKETKEARIEYIQQISKEKQMEDDHAMEWYTKGIEFGYKEHCEDIERLFDHKRIKAMIVQIVMDEGDVDNE